MAATTSNLTRPDFDHSLWHKASFTSSTGSDGHRIMTAMSIYKSEWALAELKLDEERIRRINQFRDDLAAALAGKREVAK